MNRRFIEISGPDRVPFLQGLLTQDISKLAEQKIQFAALLSPQGKILHDMFVIEDDERILLDTAGEFAPLLLKRLNMFKLRAKAPLALLEALPTGLPSYADPRLPGLPMRDYATMHLPPSPADIPELGRDFAPETLTALDAGYDLLNGVSFTKGCYVGQEVTARMHYKSIARRGWFLLERDGVAPHLANLKFDEVLKDSPPMIPPNSRTHATVDNLEYSATLPGWMQPKLTTFLAAAEKQP